ncbi:MAG: hypothetical protein U9Q07_00890 [Planctomycetota bacterium]|nr:hypothetical protein [Planctomycetota bacterium]
MMLRTAIVLAVFASVAYSAEPNEITITPHFSVEVGMGLGAAGEDLVLGSVMYWPDYANDGAVGVLVMGGDMTPEDDFAAGPVVEFPTGPIYDSLASTILPDPWAAALGNMTAAVRPYGRMSIMFDPDFDPIAVVGTGLRLFPNKHIQPALHTDYIMPSNNSDLDGLEGWWTTVSISVLF